MAYIGAIQSYNATPITSSSGLLIKSSDGALGGVFVSGTITSLFIYDNTAPSGVPLIGITTGVPSGWIPFPVALANGLYVIVVGATPNVTIFWV